MDQEWLFVFSAMLGKGKEQTMSKVPSMCLLAVLSLTVCASGQGTFYFSSIGQQPSASITVGSDAWIGQGFLAGTNAAGAYALNSILLGMNAATGNPTNFTLSLYLPSVSAFYLPGEKIADLAGPQPTGQGVFSYTASGITLSGGSVYFLVLASQTPISGGHFSVATADQPSSWVSIAGWQPVYQPGSLDGSTWTRETHQPMQFALNAALVPEPSVLALGCYGGLLLAVRWLRGHRH